MGAAGLPPSVFVAALGASSYIYAEAVAGEDLRSWIDAHIRRCEHLGGVTAAWLPDNLKSGVTKPCFYDPDINPTYANCAEHYGAVVMPARVGRHRDKAEVENAVQQVERSVLAPLRNQRSFRLAEANRAIRELLDAPNAKPLSKLEVSGWELLGALDRPALKPLPAKLLDGSAAFILQPSRNGSRDRRAR